MLRAARVICAGSTHNFELTGEMYDSKILPTNQI